MEFPGLNLSRYSDDELMAKISELHGKMNYAYAYSSSVELVSQIQAMLEVMNFEYSSRIQKKANIAELKTAGLFLETDETLIPTKDASTQEGEKKQPPRTTGGMFKRTKTPTNDNMG